MAWNEPGKGGQDPWGGGPKKQGGPEMDETIRKAQETLGKMFGNGGPSSPNANKLTGMLIGLGAVVWLLSGIYIVDPAERGVVTKFGAYSEESKPGPHWHLPYPISQVEIVNVDEVRNAELGFRSTAVRGQATGVVPSEALMLTQDENIVDIKLAIQYKVSSAKDYLYSVNNPDATLSQAAESALREVVGKSNMDYILTEGRTELVARVKTLTQEVLDRYQTGLIVLSVNMQDAQPPEQVQAAFADVVKAREDRQRFINEAEAYANDIIPKARGKAARMLEEASAYKEQVISKSEGEAQRFTSIVKQYEAAPEVTRERLYLDAMESVLTNSSKVMVNVEGGNNMMYLPLDKLMQGSQTQQQQQIFIPQAAQDAAKKAQELRDGNRFRSREVR